MPGCRLANGGGSAAGSCLRDDRQAGKVDHSLRELVQRVFSIACGYPDANDSARLSEDPIHKLLLDRDPIEGRALASQPTLSHFGNGVGVKERYRSGEFLADSVIRRHAKRPRHRASRVTIDLDPTDGLTHGAQQLSFFNGHYDTWCYLIDHRAAESKRMSRRLWPKEARLLAMLKWQHRAC
jgi:hypothetical protein